MHKLWQKAPLKASLEIFHLAGMDSLVGKSQNLTGYLEFLVGELNAETGQEVVSIITPENPDERGCQLSLVLDKGLDARHIHRKITETGIETDWREPNVIRAAPVPLYNTFEDVFQFAKILKESI